MDNNKRTVCIIAIIAIMIVVLAWSIEEWSNRRVRIFVENGYTREAVLGSDFPQWVKKDPNWMKLQTK